MPDTKPFLQPFVLDEPVIEAERRENCDIYRPDGSDAACPLVVFVHGGPIPAGLRPTPRDWPVYTGYASAVARHGATAVTVDHRLYDDAASYPTAAADVRQAVERARAMAGVDSDRVALWFFSGAGPLAAEWLAHPPSWLSCVLFTYPVMGPPDGVEFPSEWRPTEAVHGARELPMLLTRVGGEEAWIAGTVAEFVTASAALGASLEIIDVPDGRHGFDMLDHEDGSRHAVRAALAWVTDQLHAR